MTIETVKLQTSGYLINGNMGVPNDPANRHYVMVQEWIAQEGNTPAPEFTDAEIVANAQSKVNSESLAYLTETDWYVTRESETGVLVPVAVTQARTAARAAITT